MRKPSDKLQTRKKLPFRRLIPRFEFISESEARRLLFGENSGQANTLPHEGDLILVNETGTDQRPWH